MTNTSALSRSEIRPNVVLISLDTLRADVAYSGKFPNLERLRREGTCFKTVVAPAPLTPPSHATIFTGLQPPRHGIRHLLRETLIPGTPTLASVLAREGYSTGAVVSCPGLNQWYGLSSGFSHYDDEIPRLPDGRNALELPDVKLRGLAMKRAPLVVDRALQWVSRLSREPFFLFAHFFDSHWPYDPPVDYGLPIANPYEGEVAFMDHHVGKLLAGLESLGRSLDESLLVLLSDHGEDLAGWYANDHAGERGHREEEGHGCLLFDATQLVPLIIRYPKRIPVGREISSQVRLCDVAPTIWDLLGCGLAGRDGSSLLPIIDGRETADRAAYSETYFREELGQTTPEFSNLRPMKSVRLPGGQKVMWEVGGDNVQVFDLTTDPIEQHPMLIAAEPAEAEASTRGNMQPTKRAAPTEDRLRRGQVQ